MYQEKFPVDLTKKDSNTEGIQWFKNRLANIRFNLPYYSNTALQGDATLSSNTGYLQFDRDSVLVAKEALEQGGDPFWGAWDSGPAATQSPHEKAAYFAHYLRQSYQLDHDDCACTNGIAKVGYGDEPYEPDSNYPRKDQWTCPKCDSFNDEEDEKCHHCGADRPSHTERESGWVEADAKGIVNQDKTVTCPKCGGKAVWDNSPQGPSSGHWRCQHGDWHGDAEGEMPDDHSSHWKESYGPAAKVREEKEEHPERFCADKKCLWRTDEQYCPRHAPAKTTSLWKGSPYPEHGEKDPDHSAPGHHIPEKVNDIYNAIKREHPEYDKSKAMAIAWDRSGLHKEKESQWKEVGDFGMTPNPVNAQPKYILSPNAWGGYSDQQGREFSAPEAKWLVEMGRAEIGDPRPTMADEVGQQNVQNIFGEGGIDEYRRSNWHVIALGEAQMPGGVGATMDPGSTGVPNPDGLEPYADISQGGPEQRNAVQTWVNIAVNKLNTNPDFNQYPNLLADELKTMGCPEEIAEEVVSKAINQPIEEEPVQQPPAPSQVADPNAAMAEQPQPQVMRGANVSVADIEGELIGTYQDVWGTDLAAVRTQSGIRTFSGESISPVEEVSEDSPLTHIRSFLESVGTVKNSRASVAARLANMRTVRQMCRAAIHTSEWSDIGEIDKIDSDAQLEILNLSDELQWMGDAIKNKDFEYDAFDIEANSDPVEIPDHLETVMKEHPAVIVNELGEAATDPDAIQYAASNYISSFVCEFPKDQRDALTKRFIKSALYYTQETMPVPTTHEAAVTVDAEGPAESLFI